ncbi:MAG: flagellar basal body-associated FliL family protein [Peptococcaceae bacterium]
MRNNLATIILVALLSSILTIILVVDKSSLKIVSMETLEFYDTKEFTVNIKETGNRYLKTSMAFHTDQREVVKELEKKAPLINDKITLYLSNLTIEALNDEESKQRIKTDLITIINDQLEKGSVKGIYYRSFVWQ